ncbi:MAG: DUF1858 domain-containing protein [Deltaproteobacteria bacterium]|nr:DUF1858 domain-containing protein [Deltaproteobacteria bacterium]
MTDENEKPIITPDLKVGALLASYPELEEVLIEIAPIFKKLRNPVLRRTVAKLTSLRQAAKVGGVSLGDMISTLRVAVDQEENWNSEGEENEPHQERPAWLTNNTDIEQYDARADIESGGHPLPTVMSAVGKLKAGQTYAIVTPFLPAPMIDQLKQKGYQTWSEQKGKEHFVNYVAPK